MNMTSDTITDQEPLMNTPRTYVKKPVAIEAIHWTGDNTEAVRAFTAGGFETVDPFERGDSPEIVAEVWDHLHATWVGVKIGQWIIKGLKGEFYPCDPDVFTGTYEEQA